MKVWEKSCLPSGNGFIAYNPWPLVSGHLYKCAFSSLFFEVWWCQERNKELYGQEKKMEMGVCLGTGGMYSKICTYVWERGGERERGRQKVSQALRYFIKLGHSSLDNILNKKAKEDPPQHAGSSWFWWQLPECLCLTEGKIWGTS